VKVKTILENFNDMPLDEDVVIQWYRKEHIEAETSKKISREAWEIVCEWAPDYVSSADFGIPTLLERAEANND
jgi:hypothetical protein